MSSPKKRAALLTLYDGVEQAAAFLGTFLSPLVFNWIGYYGVYISRIVFYGLTLAYGIFVVKEPIKRQIKLEENKEKRPKQNVFKRVAHWFNIYMVQPFIGMLKTLAQDRPHGLRYLLWFQMFLYFFYWSVQSIPFDAFCC